MQLKREFRSAKECDSFLATIVPAAYSRKFGADLAITLTWRPMRLECCWLADGFTGVDFTKGKAYEVLREVEGGYMIHDDKSKSRRINRATMATYGARFKSV